MDEYEVQAYARGYHAGKIGAHNNPYPYLTKLWKVWNDGLIESIYDKPEEERQGVLNYWNGV